MNRTLNIAAISLFAALAAGCGAPEDGEPAYIDNLSQAVTSCYGETCNGQDPGTAGCDADPATYTATSLPVGLTGTLALRVSPACNAVWTRVSSTTPYYLRAELNRPSPSPYTAQGASLTAVTAQRSPMIGLKAGLKYTATGRIGVGYNSYQWVGSLVKTF